MNMKRIFALIAVMSALLTVGFSARGMETPQNQMGKIYKVGDYYNDGMKEGIVFQVSADVTKGKIFSLNQSDPLRWTNLPSEDKKLIGANSVSDGAYNMSKVMSIPGWEGLYPAFEWCARQGDGWYLPSKQELSAIFKNKTKLNEVLEQKLQEKLSYYWSSTEHDTKAKSGNYCAWVINLQMVYFSDKHYLQPVRAVASFDSTEPVTMKGKVYKIGDLYDDGVKKGYVFEVDMTGMRGKIMSTVNCERAGWAFFKEDQLKNIGADNLVDGRFNQAKVMELPDWKNRFPAFEWCHSLGEDWYLPAMEELRTIVSNARLLIPVVPYSVEAKFLSSTETGDSDKKGRPYVYQMSTISIKYPTSFRKEMECTVCAVTTFDSTRPTPAPAKKKYKLGDYYDDGLKEGIVFEVTDDGLHGKIVCLGESPRMQWTYDLNEASRLVGADSYTDGAYNMAKLMEVPDWETKYPVIQWCVENGEGWYVPSKRELCRIYQNKCWIETKLKLVSRLTLYWSSTESDEFTEDGLSTMWNMTLSSGYMKPMEKINKSGSVRAVAVF
jgi:hypothetical protein